MVIGLREFLADGTPLRNLRGSLQELVDSHAKVGLINSAIHDRDGQRIPSKWRTTVSNITFRLL
jgi:hypothetical protein